MWTFHIWAVFSCWLFSHVDCILIVYKHWQQIDYLHKWPACGLFTAVDSILTLYTSGQHVDCLHKWTACWLFTQVDSMLTIYTSGQHIDCLHKWTAYCLFTQVDSMLTVYTDCLHKWTACWQFTQVDSIATICTSGQHIEFERVDSMFTVFWSLTLWTVFRSPWTQANCWGLSLIDIVDCVQITMWDLNTGKLLRTIADAHPPGTAVLHVKVRLATSLKTAVFLLCFIYFWIQASVNRLLVSEEYAGL